MVDQASSAMGLGFLVQEWLADRSIVMLTLFVVISWKYFGFHMILMLAGLQGIPRELEEAAAIDGASRRQTVRQHHPAAARADHPGLGVPVDHRRHPAVRPGLGDHQGRALQRLEHDGRSTSSTVGIERTPDGLRQRRRGHPVRDLARRGRSLYVRFVMRRDTDGALTTGGG